MAWRARMLAGCTLVGVAAALVVTPPMPTPQTVGRQAAPPLRISMRVGDGGSRRAALEQLGVVVLGLGTAGAAPAVADTCSRKDCQPKKNFLQDGDEPKKTDMVQMPGLKGKDYGKTTTKYPDFVKTDSGLQYKDVKVGTGPTPEAGDRVVYDWEGYTIGYYGRIFKAKSGVKGGAFNEDTEYERFIVGSGAVVPGLEEAMLGMSVGGVRQIVVPPELGYPEDDAKHEKVGPKPPNFDGQRALNFVLYNQGLIDKTLLFNVKIIRIDKAGSLGRKSKERQPPKTASEEPEEDEE